MLLDPGATDAATVDRHGSPPPPDDATTYERLRDSVLAAQETKIFAAVTIVYILCVVGDGAFFFFLLVDWTTISPESAVHYWFNVSIQVLCALFTWGAVMDTPWRLANWLHIQGVTLGGTRRACEPGLDFYGRPTDQIWFHIPLLERARLLRMLLANILSQLANQGTRIAYRTFESTTGPPGSLLVNVFFAAAFMFAIWGAIYQVQLERRLARADPERFVGQDKVEAASQAVSALSFRAAQCCRAQRPYDKQNRRRMIGRALIALACLALIAVGLWWVIQHKDVKDKG